MSRHRRSRLWPDAHAGLPMIEADRWIWVSMDHATFAVGIKDKRIAIAPPIARWAVGESEGFAAAYWRSRGAVFKELPT